MLGVHRQRAGRRFVAVLVVATLAAAMAALSVSVKGMAADTPDISFQPGDDVSGPEPLTVGADSVVGRFIDPDNFPPITRPSGPTQISFCGDTSVYTATIDWGDGTATDTATVGCSDVDTSQFAVYVTKDHTYTDSRTSKISITVSDSAIDDGKGTPAKSASTSDADTAQTATATVDDATISAGTPDNVTGTEGQNVAVTAKFLDHGTGATSDGGLSATVDWGDGTTSPGTLRAATEADHCECNVVVTASHDNYDARATNYNVSVKLTDDGGSTKTSTLTATIADAALTKGSAKSFTATGGQAGTFTVASFTDGAGAQASAADFTASIKWGDGTTTAGTVSKTASGAFNVSGSHTYATAGTKSLTITVTDEEGQTVTMSATATVPVLPATGQPSAPAPGWALIFMALLLGGVSLSTLGFLRARR